MSTPTPTQAVPARRFGRFELRSLVGKSLASNTWLAFDARLQAEVLLCVPRVQPVGTAERERWTQDVQLASKLKHPRLAPVVDMGVHEGWPFTVHDRGSGPTLADRLAAGQPHFTTMEVVALVIDVLDGMAYAHDAGVAHKDLALHNVLLDSTGRAALVGLSVGLAAKEPGGREDTLSRQEQRAAAERDIVMVGLLMHRLLAGHPALDDADLGHVAGRLGLEIIRLPWTTPQPVPDTLRAIVNRATDRQQRQRYLNARTLLAALQGWVKANSQESAGPLALFMDRLNSVGHLPSRAADMTSVHRLLTNESLRVDEIVDQLVRDPAMCWELLKVINTARYQAGTDESVTSLSRTIVLLGQSGLQRVCYGVRTWPGVLKAAESLKDTDSATAAIDALSHEMKLACVVALTARWLRPFNVGDEEVMMAAMSQRLGRLLVLYHYPEESAQITRLMQPGPPPEPEGKPTPGMSYEAAVGAVLGINPDELTSAVLKHWGLGDSIIQATKPYGASMPHRPESPDEWLRLIANLSNELAALVGVSGRQQQQLLTQILTRYARPSQTSQKELQDALRRALGSVDARWLARTFPAPATA